MELEEFIVKRPFLYHLTSKTNASNIIAQKKLFSTNQLIALSSDVSHQKVKREKRPEHYSLVVNGIEIHLRDQRPISPLALSKCLTDGWGIGDFLEHLNDRVFMWPTPKRLQSHFGRYESEGPVVFRIPTRDVLQVNPHVKFCRLNSGATRANSYLGGKAPERGPSTFLLADKYSLPITSVAEVTFETQCLLPSAFEYSFHPDGPYLSIDEFK